MEGQVNDVNLTLAPLPSSLANRVAVWRQNEVSIDF